MTKLAAQRRGWARAAKVVKRKTTKHPPTKKQIAQRKWRCSIGQVGAATQLLNRLAQNYGVKMPVEVLIFTTELSTAIYLHAQANGVNVLKKRN